MVLLAPRHISGEHTRQIADYDAEKAQSWKIPLARNKGSGRKTLKTNLTKLFLQDAVCGGKTSSLLQIGSQHILQVSRSAKTYDIRRKLCRC